MKYTFSLKILFCITMILSCKADNIFESELQSSYSLDSTYPENKLTIIGGGVVGAFQVYYAYLNACKTHAKLRVTIYEKNKNIADTTVSHIVPSLTPDEILSVVPRGKELVKKLQILFSQPGGIRIDDVINVNDSKSAIHFMEQAEIYSQDDEGYQKRTQALLSLGKMSMDLWQKIYDDADSELKAILIESNFNPCREPRKEEVALHDGYRIDLIYNVPNAAERAHGMECDYKGLGYSNCKILSPEEVIAFDPFLTDFCTNHSTLDAAGIAQWHNDSVALWRPGGCIDTQVFLPKFYTYLKKVMGTYINKSGKVKDCFQLRFEREVQRIEFTEDFNSLSISGLYFNDGYVKRDNYTYKTSAYSFCPGEAVGMLTKFGLKEPAYARFAGASLMMNIPIPVNKIADYSAFNHCMEVHQEGVVLAWQARFRNDKIFIGVAGTKAFYGDQQPGKDHDFAKNRNLLQLNMINDVLPEFISIALERDTKGQQLTESDLHFLEMNGFAERWAGTRAVAFDGFPTLGIAYSKNGIKINNAFVATHLGSGGGSFAPAAVVVSRSDRDRQAKQDPLIATVLDFARSDRSA